MSAVCSAKMMNRRLWSLLFVLACAVRGATAQGSAGTGAEVEPRFVIDMPTAGMLASGALALDVDLYADGGVLAGLSYGIFDRLMLGLSYGGTGLIGSGEAQMDELPGVAARIRVLEESVSLPALAIGFDSQGRDGYVPSRDRYRIKSPGIFAAVSKNYTFAGFLSVHGGGNYSLERSDDSGVNWFAGLEKSIGGVLSLLVEYNVGLNDNADSSLGKGHGYLGVALRWSVSGGVTLGVYLKDLLENGGEHTVANRSLRLEFVTRL